MNCTHCQKSIPTSGGIPAFCPWCGEKIENTHDTQLEILLEAIKTEEDTLARHEKILAAQKLFPDSTELKLQALYLGRMWERGGKPDFFRIPFWPLNAIEKPRQFSAKERRHMLDVFFNNPELAAVCAESDDPDATLNEYLEHISKLYIDLFIKSSNSNSFFLGFRRSAKDNMYRCAECVATMLNNLAQSPEIDTKYKKPLAQALVKGFEAVFGEAASQYTEELRKKA